jgi:hypothetical protein
LKLATYDFGERSRSVAAMSARTRSVAVAERAMIGASGNSSRSSASLRYSGRKSCPHSLMQCASSTATARTSNPASDARNPGARSLCGAT